MKPTKQPKQQAETNIIELLLFRYLPYWPLFVIILLLSMAGAWFYLEFSTPLYKATGTLMVNDSKKGVDDSKLMEALNIYSSKKIVENEIEVLHSRAIINEVVKELNLYAPIQEDGGLKSYSAYNSSPVIIEARDPAKIIETEKIYFTYKATNEIIINNHSYPLNKWVKTPYGEIQFRPNEKRTRQSSRPLFFSLRNQHVVSDIYLSNLQVSAASKLSTVINLSIKDEVPQRGEDIINKVLETYIKFSIREKNKLASNTLAFVKDRLSYVEDELDSMQKNIQQYKSEKRVTDLSEQGKLYLHNVGDNDRKAGEINMQLAVLDQIENYVVSKNDKSGISPSTMGINDPVLGDLLQKLRDTELKYEIVRKTSAENNPTVLSLATQIESIRPGILENIRNQKKALKASHQELAGTTVRYNSLLQSIPKKERELLDISRQQIIKSDVYTFLLHKREETALAYASTVANSWVVDSAQSTNLPVSPNKMIIALIAFVLALIISTAIVAVKEVFNRKVLFRSEIETATKVRVAAEILFVKGKKDLVITQEKGSVIAEQFRQLRAAIGMYGKNISVNKLLVTSSIPGEGKSFVSANLALSLAYSGKKVLLMDFDMRNPVTSSITGITDKDGLSEYLEGKKEPHEIIHNVMHKNLFVMSAGGETVNPTELLLTGNVDGLFQSLKDSFDYFIIDTAPIASVIDAYVLSEYSDTTLFVIRHNYTPKTMVQLLDENTKLKALKNVSIVFNGLHSRGIMKGDYGYGYGYGYGYDYVYKERVRNTQKSIVKQ